MTAIFTEDEPSAPAAVMPLPLPDCEYAKACSSWIACMFHWPGTRELSAYGSASNVEGAGLPAAVFCAAVNPSKYGSFGQYVVVTELARRRAPAVATLTTPLCLRSAAST